MKASAGPGIELADVPSPSLGPNDVRIEVRLTSICGTDLHIFRWDEWAARTIPVPMVVGHEVVGTVAELGSEVTGLVVGQRVSVEGHVTCGHCRNCRAGQRHLCRNSVGLGVNRQGAFADELVMPAGNVYPVSARIPDEVAAILDPLGNATHTALSFDLVGEDVLITGAGPIGLMGSAIARHVGARHVVLTDVNPYRLAIGTRMGADRCVNLASESLPDVIAELGMAEGFDVGMEMSGVASALNDMIRVMNNGGHVGLLGIPSVAEAPLDWNDIIFKGLTLRGIYGRRMFETWYKMTAMLETGLDVTPVVTHRFGVQDHAEAFAVVESGRCGKVLLDWA